MVGGGGLSIEKKEGRARERGRKRRRANFSTASSIN